MKKISHLLTSHVRHFKKHAKGFSVGLFVFSIILIGFMTLRGASPAVSELAFTEYSSLGRNAGSIIPASCVSGQHYSHPNDINVDGSIDSGCQPVCSSGQTLQTDYVYRCRITTSSCEGTGENTICSSYYEYTAWQSTYPASCPASVWYDPSIVQQKTVWSCVTPAPPVGGCTYSYSDSYPGVCSEDESEAADGYNYNVYTCSDGSTNIEVTEIFSACSGPIPTPTCENGGLSGQVCCFSPNVWYNSSCQAPSCANGGIHPSLCCPPAQEWNGSACVPIYVPRPDLTVGAVSPTSVLQGTNVTLSATVTNQGDASTGSAFNNFIQVATAENGGGTVTNLASVSMSTLSSGASSATSRSYTFPAAGTYSARACADKSNPSDGGTINESNEGNNCGSWTNISVVINPTITNETISFPNISFICNNATSYTVTHNETGVIIGQGPTTSGATVNVQFSQEGNYSLVCSQGAFTASTVLNYTIPPVTSDGLSITASPRTVNNNKNTTLSWSVLNPRSTCSLRAESVCAGGHGNCSAAQLDEETALNNTLTTGNTDANDPYGPNRNIQTAVKTVYTEFSNKAMGKKTLLMNNTTDFILDCGSSVLKKIRVVVSNENEG